MTKKLQETVDQNSKDITDIKQTLVRLETNHIHHIEKDMCAQSKRIEKMDMRLWAILLILVGSTVIGGIVNMIGT